jgi:hypothetical protein
MGFIPFTDSPVRYTDSETGVVYLLRQPTDEVELKLIDIKNQLPKERNELNTRAFINDTVDIILCGWESSIAGFPAFPEDGKPSKKMPSVLKMRLMDRWREAGNFTKDELKK